MRALSELAGVIVAGLVAFFAGIAFVLGLLFLWLCGLASVLCLIVAVVAGIMYAFTRNYHDAVTAFGYLGYAAVPFVVIFVLTYYHGKISDGRQQRQKLQQIGSLRIVQEAD